MSKNIKGAEKLSTAKKRTSVKRSAKSGYPTTGYAPSFFQEPTTIELSYKSDIIHWLGVPASITKSLASDFDVLKLCLTGITKGSINKLASHIGISRKNMAEEIFDVSIKTLERKDDNSLLDKKTSSHAIEIARLMQHAYEVFKDETKLKFWINRENKALNNMKPVQLFDTLSGINMVNDVLGRIEEGVYT